MNKTLHIIGIFLSLLIYSELNAQCNISMSGIPCVDNVLTFDNNATNPSSVKWSFNHEGTSTQSKAGYSFSVAGMKKIYLETNISGNICYDTLEIEVFPLPEIKSEMVSEYNQCLQSNEFCFVDSTAFFDCIKSIKYQFDDGELVSFTNPTDVITFCKSYKGSNPYVMDYDIEIVNCNDCVKKYKAPRPLEISIGKQISFSSTNAKGCDTVTGHFVNNSSINFSDVEKFLWIWGDGSVDSTNWGDNGISHFFPKPGPFSGSYSVTLRVWEKGGCVGEFTLNFAVSITETPRGIAKLNPFYCPGDIIEPEADGVFPPTMKFNWSMTDASGKPNVQGGLFPQFTVNGIGPHRLVFETSYPGCPDKLFADTFFVTGPYVKIEDIDSGVIIPQNQRYQCVSKDTVYFPNMTRYYMNDQNLSNDDSIIKFPNGDQHWVFDADLNPLSPQNIERKDDNIFRVWDFGDEFAEQCTTVTKLGINVDKNCNFSMDRYPKHFYTPWDTVYKYVFYLPNKPLIYLDVKPDGDCEIRMVDNSEPDLHRKIFFNRIPECIEAKLTEIDTVMGIPCKKDDNVRLIIQKPDLSNIQISGGGCLSPNATNVNLNPRFDLTKPGCSFNMFLFNPNVKKDSNNWITFIPEPPDNGYDETGMFSPSINYTYDSSVYNITDDTLVVGLIIANGVGDNICYDTVFVQSPFDIGKTDSKFEILAPENEPKKVCIGDTIVFGDNDLTPLISESIDRMTWTISMFDTKLQKDSVLGIISELRRRAQTHPDPDSIGILADFLDVDNNLTGESKKIMLNEIYDYRTVVEIDDNGRAELQRQWVDLGLPVEEYSDLNIVKFFWNGIGAFGNSASGSKGCIDTTGLTKHMYFKTFVYGKRIKHYRDTSLLPIDTNFVDGKLYNNSYFFAPKANGLYKISLGVISAGDCISIKTKSFVVGFNADAELTDSIFCSNSMSDFKPKFRYYNTDQSKGMLDTTDYWNLRKDKAGTDGYEGITKVDWSIEDDDLSKPNTIYGNHPYGEQDYKSSYILGGDDAGKLYYQEPGRYTLRITTSDSTGCRDTVSKTIYILDNKAKFNINIKDLNCNTIIEFFDSSTLLDVYDSLFGSPAHEYYSWRIDWGDGVENEFHPSLPPQVGHIYKGFGVFKVKLISETGGLLTKRQPACSDTFEMELKIPGPEPYFEELTPLEICLGDSVSFKNLSNNPTEGAQFVWNMGDSTFITTDGGETITHTYKRAGVYYVSLLQSDSLPGTVHYCSNTYPDTSFQPAVMVIVKAHYEAEIIQDKNVICVGDSVLFTVKGVPDASKFNWSVEPDSVYAETIDSFFRYRFENSGLFDIFVKPDFDSTAMDEFCSAVNTVQVFVDSIRADFEVDTSNIPRVCFKNTSVNSVNNTWGFYHKTDITKTGAPFIFSKIENEEEFCLDYPDSSGYYWTCLIAENPEACTDTICKLIRYAKEQKIWIPNVFTPGADNYNDFFLIDIEGHNYYDLYIYNRWGDLVFSSDDMDYQWNGKVFNEGEECPDGVYIYKFGYRFEKMEEIENVSGVITLIREKR